MNYPRRLPVRPINNEVLNWQLNNAAFRKLDFDESISRIERAKKQPSQPLNKHKNWSLRALDLSPFVAKKSSRRNDFSRLDSFNSIQSKRKEDPIVHKSDSEISSSIPDLFNDPCAPPSFDQEEKQEKHQEKEIAKESRESSLCDHRKYAQLNFDDDELQVTFIRRSKRSDNDMKEKKSSKRKGHKKKSSKRGKSDSAILGL